MRKIILVISFLLSGINLLAQTDCNRNLNEAKSDFANGNLYAIPGKLTDCLKEGFSKSEKIDAYRLLTLTYLNINQNEKAKESLIKLLNIKTDYQVTINVDPPELYSLYKKIDTDPKYFIGLSAGINYNTIQIKDFPDGQSGRFSQNPYSGQDIYKYTPKFSFQAGAQFMYPILKNLWLRSELMYQNQKYDYYEEIINIEATESKNKFYAYESSSDLINLSISARRVLDNYRWKPFVELGIISSYNIKYNFNNYISEDTEELDIDNIDNIKMIEYRKKFNIGLNAQIGTMLKIGEYYGEMRFGVNKFLIAHANYANDSERSIKTVGNRGEVIEDNYNNLLYEISFAFNIAFFNFK